MSELINLLEIKNDIKNAIKYKGGIIEGGMTTYANSIIGIDSIIENDIERKIAIPANTKFGYSTIKVMPKIDTSSYTDMSNMFRNCSNLTSVEDLDTSNVINIDNMFSGCSSLTSVSNLSFLKLESGFGLFSGCSSLTSVSNLDFSNVINIDNMFSGCSSLTSVSNLSFLKLESVLELFSGCSSLTYVENLNFSSLEYQALHSTKGMFSGCSSLTSVSNLSFPKLESGIGMFYGCSSLTSVEIDTPIMNDGASMFENCSSLETISIGDNFQSIQQMFYGCSSLTSIPDIFGWPSAQVNNMRSAFYNCSSLESLPEINVYGCNVFDWAFKNCISLKNFGGLASAGSGNYVYIIDLSDCPLTKQSAMNVIKYLYDRKADNYTKTATVKFSKSTLSLLSNKDIAIATAKGWTITT